MRDHAFLLIAIVICSAFTFSGCTFMTQRKQTEPTTPASADTSSSTQPTESAANQTPAPAPEPSGPARVSITLRSDCRQTMKIFFGRKPGFSSGRQSTLAYNTSESHSGDEGDMIWLLDESGDGISSVTLSSGMREVTINSSCSGFKTR